MSTSTTGVTEAWLTGLVTFLLMFLLMSWTTYRVYKLPEDGTGRRAPLIGAGLFGMTCFAFGIAAILSMRPS